jgi:peptidoglycan biosynthesis protein MviN/MurJ (putative lipid II flippase)
VENPSPQPRRGSLAAGAVTALALTVQIALAAVVGVIIGREFGHSAETDGFFAAYGVFVTLGLAANAIRVTVLPRFALARASCGLSSEVASYLRVVLVVLAPVVAVMWLGGARPAAALLTGFGPAEARSTAAAALPWMVIAATGQVLAGVLASALAALDDYATAAASFAIGSVAGLVLILIRIDADGIDAVAWGIALNAGLAVALPALALAVRARRERVSRAALRPSGRSPTRRLGELVAATVLPLTLQLVYVICLPLAAQNGVGAVTSLGYAYLIGAAVVTVTASSLSLVTTVPLARVGIDPSSIARHVDASSWMAILAIGATVGVFALSGETIVSKLFGEGYESDVGAELGGVVVALAPWMVVSVAFSVVFPIIFVAGRHRRLPVVAVATIAAHVPLALLGQDLFGLDGLAVALAFSSLVAVVLLLHLLRALRLTLAGLAVPVALTTGLTLAAYVPAGLALDGAAYAALAGTVGFASLLALARPRGLADAWHYLRALA